jgi:hypothetical protein
MKRLITQYIREYFPSHDNDWFDFVKSKKILDEKIETAVLSLNSSGKMHGHQRRVGLDRLKKYAQSMLTEVNVERLKKALRTKDFHNVYSVFKEETKNHYMVSSLTAYDVAQRICSIYGIEPKFVYLHTGTTDGAKNLGISIRRKEYLKLNELPNWITASLGPADIENFLCIFKDEIAGRARKTDDNCPPVRGNRHIKKGIGQQR